MKAVTAGLVAAVLSAAFLASCQSSSQGAAAGPSPAAGQIVGKLVVTDSTHASGRAAPDVTLGLYLEAFAQIGNQYAPTPPHPVAVATTGFDGSFAFSGLAPGRYFLAIVGAGLFMPGQWITLASGSGTSVQLQVCGDCPVPA